VLGFKKSNAVVLLTRGGFSDVAHQAVAGIAMAGGFRETCFYIARKWLPVYCRFCRSAVKITWTIGVSMSKFQRLGKEDVRCVT
jgi:hypothetical protein